MNHFGEEQLVLFYYGESAESAAIESHLDSAKPAGTSFERYNGCSIR